MDSIRRIEKPPESKRQGILQVFQVPLKVTVEEGSFLHIGGTPSPLSEKKAPVFAVDGKPVIPASSFKGAFRYQVEQLLIASKDELKAKLGVTDDESFKPCIPATRPSRAEKALLAAGYRECCEIRVEENRIVIPEALREGKKKPIGLCPVCYLFGAPGLMGFLRIPNLWPGEGEYRIEQTNIRIDRKSGTAASGAIVTGEQVKPGTVFRGTLEIVDKQGDFEFGRPREVGGTRVDVWLEDMVSKPAGDAKLLLINEILIPSLNNITVLGGQKSRDGGKVRIEV